MNTDSTWKIVWREIGWDYTDEPDINISTVRSGWAAEFQGHSNVYCWIENGCLAIFNEAGYLDYDIPLDIIEKLKNKKQKERIYYE